MSLIPISKGELSKSTLKEFANDERDPDEPDFIIVQEVDGLPPPTTRLGVDPRLETTVKMINAIEEKQKKLIPLLNKIPKTFEKEADYSNRQLNHLAAVQESSKKYLSILSGAVTVLAAIAVGRLVYMGVGIWKLFKKSKTPTTATESEGKEVAAKGNPATPRNRSRRLHQRDWRILDVG